MPVTVFAQEMLVDMRQLKKYNQNMRKKAQEKKEPEQKQYYFEPAKEIKQERKARINAVVKKALEGIKQRDSKTPETPNNANHPVAIS